MQIKFAPLAYRTVALLEGQNGPQTPYRYAYCIDYDAHYQWNRGSTTTADGLQVLEPSGGTPGRWVIVGGLWNYASADPISLNGLNVCSYEQYRDTPVKLCFSPHNASAVLSGSLQMPRTWKAGTEVNFVVQTIPCAATSGTVAISYSYVAIGAGSAVPALSAWTTSTATLAVTSADQYKTIPIPIDSIGMSHIQTEGAHVLFKIERAIGTDSYTGSKDHGTSAANLAILSAGVHYMRGQGGTRSEYPEE